MALVDLLKLTPVSPGGWQIAKVVLGDNIPTYILGTGTADATTFLSGDLTWTTPPGGGATDLGLANLNNLTLDITSSTGTGITMPEATTLLAGLLIASDKIKLNNTSGINTGDETNATILAKIGYTPYNATNPAGYITGAQVPANETDPVFNAWLAGPPNISIFNNDVPYLTSLAGAVTNVSATSPITSSGGATPVISTSMNTSRLIGRSTAGVGVMEEITLGTGLSFTGTTLNVSGFGGETLAQTLVLGNITGGTRIVISDGDFITGSGGQIQFDFGADNQIWLNQDGGLGNLPNLYMDANFWQIGSSTTTRFIHSDALSTHNKHDVLIELDAPTIQFDQQTGVGTSMATLSATGVLGRAAIPSAFITAISDTATINLTVTGTTLSADVIDNTSIQKILIGSNGTIAGTRERINFSGSNLLDVLSTDNVVNDRVDVQVVSSMNTNSLVGRSTAGLGQFEEITLGTNLSFSGTTLNVTTGAGGVTSVTGTLNRITSTGGTTPVINISASYDALWQPVDADLTAIAALGFTSLAFLKKTAANTWALDTNTYLSNTPAALTKTDDTNITLTLGGTPATALLQAVSLTLGWTGTLADAKLSTTAVTAASYGSATASPTFTVGATGRLTAAANITITPAVGSITGLGTNVATYLAEFEQRIIMTAGNQTTSSSTLGNITELVSSSLTANKRYRIEGVMFFSVDNTGGAKIAVVLPAGATVSLGITSRTTGTTAMIQPITASATENTTAFTTQTNNISPLFIEGEVSLAGTAGTIQFQFKSNTNTQTTTIYQLGSFIKITQLN